MYLPYWYWLQLLGTKRRDSFGEIHRRYERDTYIVGMREIHRRYERYIVGINIHVLCLYAHGRRRRRGTVRRILVV